MWDAELENAHRCCFKNRHLLAFFSPALKSLRRLEDVFQHPQARRRFGRPRLPKSTVSDAQALCDPTLPVPLIADLKQRVALTPLQPEIAPCQSTFRPGNPPCPPGAGAS
jgi:hypothetical protein